MTSWMRLPNIDGSPSSHKILSTANQYTPVPKKNIMKFSFVFLSFVCACISAAPALPSSRSLRGRSNGMVVEDLSVVVNTAGNETLSFDDKTSDSPWDMATHVERQLSSWQYYNGKGQSVSDSDLLCHNNHEMKYGYSSCVVSKVDAINSVDLWCNKHGGRLYNKDKWGCRWAYQCCRYKDDRKCA